MGAWPENGVEDWNTDMRAHLTIGHELSDGTHKKAQMLTDMEWDPTAYTGGETTTYPNAFIIKGGLKTGTGAKTITFGTAFPNACISLTFTDVAPAATAGGTNNTVVSLSAASADVWINTDADVTGAYWIAIGW